MLLLWLILIVHARPLWLLFNLFRIALWPSVGKELSPWLFTCADFVLSAVLIVGSRLVFRAACGFRLYRFIAFLSTFHMELLWDRGTSVQMILVTWFYPGPYMVKHFRTEWPRSLKLGIQHWALKSYQVCSCDDSRLTFLRKDQIWFLRLLYRKHVNSISQKLLQSMM